MSTKRYQNLLKHPNSLFFKKTTILNKNPETFISLSACKLRYRSPIPTQKRDLKPPHKRDAIQTKNFETKSHKIHRSKKTSVKYKKKPPPLHYGSVTSERLRHAVYPFLSHPVLLRLFPSPSGRGGQGGPIIRPPPDPYRCCFRAMCNESGICFHLCMKMLCVCVRLYRLRLSFVFFFFKWDVWFYVRVFFVSGFEFFVEKIILNMMIF